MFGLSGSTLKYLPGKARSALDRVKFEEMKKEFYVLRGRDKATGLQTKAELEALDLKDVAAEPEQRGLVI